MTHLTSDMLQIISQETGRCADIIFCNVASDLLPDVAVVPLRRTMINVPCAKMNERFLAYQTGCFHVAELDIVMGGENELCIREFIFQKVADLSTMARINGHQHVVENGECE